MSRNGSIYIPDPQFMAVLTCLGHYPRFAPRAVWRGGPLYACRTCDKCWSGTLHTAIKPCEGKRK